MRDRREIQTAAQARARSRTQKKKGKPGERIPQPANWSTAFKKGGIAAVLFGGILALLGQNPIQIVLVAVAMLGFYVPLSFVMDRFFYDRYLRKEAKKQQERETRRTGGAQQPEG